MDTLNDNFNNIRCSNFSALGFKFKTGFHVTIYHLSLVTVWGEWLLRMIPEVCLFTNVYETNRQRNKIETKSHVCQISLSYTSVILAGVFWSTAWTAFMIAISPESLNRFKTLSKISTFTLLLIKTNAQLHLKMLAATFTFWKFWQILGI